MSIMSSIQTGVKQLATGIANESPSILTALATAGVVTTVALAIHGTTKAVRLMDEERKIRTDKSLDEIAKDEEGKDVLIPGVPYEEPTLIDIAEITWKAYIPTIGMMFATIACVIGANSINLKRNAALASLYSLSETAFREYKEQVVEKLGQKSEDKVYDGLAEKSLREKPLNTCEVIMTGGGDSIFRDSLSGRTFKGDMQKIRKAINDCNFDILNHTGYLSVNEWYDALNLDHTDMGGYYGWTNNGLIDVHFSPQMSEDGERAVIVLNYKIMPHKV